MARRPAPSLSRGTPFIQRLGYYLMGLAIGLLMVGMIVSMRRQAMNTASGPGGPANPAVTEPQR